MSVVMESGKRLGLFRCRDCYFLEGKAPFERCGFDGYETNGFAVRPACFVPKHVRDAFQWLFSKIR